MSEKTSDFKNIPHTIFSMDNSGAQTCLQHKNTVVPAQNHWERTHIHPFDIAVFGVGSDERILTIIHAYGSTI